jgi:hypothetical protein
MFGKKSIIIKLKNNNLNRDDFIFKFLTFFIRGTFLIFKSDLQIVRIDPIICLSKQSLDSHILQ